jgi:hypothetical protein
MANATVYLLNANKQLLRSPAATLTPEEKRKRYQLMQELYKKAANKNITVYTQLQSLPGPAKLEKLFELVNTPEPSFKRKSTHIRTLRRTNSVRSMAGLSDNVKRLLSSMAYLDGEDPVTYFTNGSVPKKPKLKGGTRRNKIQKTLMHH